METPGINNKSFEVYLGSNIFGNNEIVTIGSVRSIKVKVISTPKITWCKRILQFITFGIYKPPITYKVKPIDRPANIVQDFDTTILEQTLKDCAGNNPKSKDGSWLNKE